MTESAPKAVFKRVLLKLSGEALMGSGQFGIDPKTVSGIVEDIKEGIALGVEFGIVIGGGNIFRGVQLEATGIDRATGDYMGMLATVMNCMALTNALSRAGVDARLQTALTIKEVAEPYARDRALSHLAKGHVVVFGAGTGNPFFTTDTTAALRGAEINADVVLKATKVDGIYTADPKKDPTATRYTDLTFDDALRRDLRVMDSTAFALCRDQHLPIKVFDINKHGALRRVLLGEDEGTLVHC